MQRFENFLYRTREEVYSEEPSEEHAAITEKMVHYALESFPLPTGSRVLDVGCGQGPALAHFEAKGFGTEGITLNNEDIQICRKQGFRVQKMDQSFLTYKDETFRLIWCRHCLEHSIFPFFTLSGFLRVLEPNGLLYIEVPAPGTDAKHQNNPNHYSVLGKEMWLALMRRSGFQPLQVLDITLTIPAGADIYWAFILEKGKTETV